MSSAEANEVAEVDDATRAYFKRFSTKAEPSEHFPLMELPAYDIEEVIATREVLYQSEKEYGDEDAAALCPPQEGLPHA